MTQLKKKRTKDSINPDQSINKHLSIQFSLDGFSFCVLDKKNKEYITLFDYQFDTKINRTPQNLVENISKIFAENDVLKDKYLSISVCHVNDLSSLVPKPLFNKDKLSTYVEYNNKVFKNDYFVYDELDSHEIINVYAPYVNVNNFLIDKFGSFEYKHFSTILVENLYNVYKYSLAPQMFANINSTHFELVVIKDKKLQLYNTFKYVTKEDFIYYILFTAEQLKMNPEKFKLQLLGAIEKDDELYTIAYKYVRNVSLLENRSKYKFDSSFTEEDKRSHFTLLNLV